MQGSSKDRASLEALEDHTPLISCNAPPEDLLLDDAAREDTIREDAPLATSHNPSLLLPNPTDMPGGFPTPASIAALTSEDQRLLADCLSFY